MSLRNELNREHGKELNELALFAGAGGGILGGLLLGWRTVCAVEYDAYARRVLLARQRDGCLHRFPIWDDIRTFDGRPWQGHVDVISGGFPCQDISAAGKGAGITGERSGLWREMARIIGEVGPRYVLVENSPMLTVRGLGVVLGELAKMGYDARWGVLGAHHAGAPHKRDRIWIVANDSKHGRGEGRSGRLDSSGAWEPEFALPAPSNAKGQGAGENYGGVWQRACGIDGRQGADLQMADAVCIGSRKESGELAIQEGTAEEPKRREPRTQLSDCCEAVANAVRVRGEAGVPEQEQRQARVAGVLVYGGSGRACQGSWWESEPDVGRVAHGVASRVDRLRCIGNGQVPAVVKLAWEALK